jgi:hypothetical protein
MVARSVCFVLYVQNMDYLVQESFSSVTENSIELATSQIQAGLASLPAVAAAE